MNVAKTAAGGDIAILGRIGLAGRGLFKVGGIIERRAITALRFGNRGYDPRYYSEGLVRTIFKSGTRYTPGLTKDFFSTIPMSYKGNQAALNIWTGKLTHYLPRF